MGARRAAAAQPRGKRPRPIDLALAVVETDSKGNQTTGRERLLSALNGGASRDDAARHGGISPDALRRELSAGDDLREQSKQAPARELLEAVEKVEVRVRVRLHAQVNQAAGKDWRASLALLDRPPARRKWLD